jgi:hypothetical protein
MLPPVTIAITQTVAFGSGGDQHPPDGGNVRSQVPWCLRRWPIRCKNCFNTLANPFHAAKEGLAINGESPGSIILIDKFTLSLSLNA